MKHICTLVLLPLYFISSAQTFNGTGGVILNNGTNTYFNLPVSGLVPSQLDSNFGIEEVCLNIQHPALEELYIYLQSPNGTIVELTEGTSCKGSNFTNTCFANSADTSVTLAKSPYTGSYKPIGYFGRFNTGATALGTWTLIVQDYLAFVNSGNLLSWSIKFGNAPPPPVSFTSSNLPIVIINTNNQEIAATSIVASMGIINNGVGQRNYLTDPANDYNSKVAIHIRGNSTRYFEKKSFSIETRDMAGVQINVSILGMPPENDWDLVAPYQDKTLMRIPLGYDLFRRMGHYASRFKNVELVINGEYRGVYHILEKPKRGKNRIDVSKLQSTDNLVPQITGGYILKIDRSNTPGWVSSFAGNSPNNKPCFFAYNYPDTTITAAQKTYIQSYLDSFEVAVNTTSLYSANGYGKYIDLKSFIDYFIISELSKNIDAYRISTYIYKDNISKGGKLHIGPVWDFGIAWHNCDYSNAYSPAGWEYQIPDSVNPSPTWWGFFMKDSNFVNSLYCRWQQLRTDILSINYLNSYIDSSANALNESMQRNFIQWPVIGTYIWPNPQNEFSASYANEVIDLKKWIADRIAWMDAAITGHCPIGTGIRESSSVYDLSVFPNPFEQRITFHLRLKESAKVTLKIMDLTGKVIAIVLDENKFSGEYKLFFDRKDVSSGLYFFQLQINNNVQVGKVIVQ